MLSQIMQQSKEKSLLNGIRISVYINALQLQEGTQKKFSKDAMKPDKPGLHSFYLCLQPGYPWQDVQKEMIDEKGLTEEVANKIGQYVQMNGKLDLIRKTACRHKFNKGVSIGIERILAVIEAKLISRSNKIRTTEVEVYIASAQKNLLEERMKVCEQLWSEGIKAEQSYKKNPKLLAQLQHCEDYGIPLAIIIGESEIQKGVVKLRTVTTRNEIEVPRAQLVNEIRNV
ncbi:hypothetical protein FQA39_LY19105 [Lamprigera yunnana]|nr:hypothetical protein FQA39_LY19105 [Lamprigera yunnana]